MKKALFTKRVLIMLLVLFVVLFFVSCANNEISKETSNITDNIISETNDSADVIVDNDYERPDYNSSDEFQSETLLYPSQNNEWSYNVYNSYIEITDYIGEEVTELIVPEEIDNLPVRVYSVSFPPKSIVSVKLPSTIVIIGEHAFSNTGSLLTSINLPEGLIEIGDYAFKECDQLVDIEIPSTIRKIGASAFEYCHSINSLTIPAAIEEIGTGAFWGCTALEKVTILNPNISLDISNLTSKVIYGYIGSTAAAYAANAKIPFKVIEK